MSKDNIWFPFYVNDYMGGTRRMSLEERGAYIELMICYWNAGGPIESDDKSIRNILGISAAKWKKIKPNLYSKFEEKDGFIYHERIDVELAKVAELREKRRKGGKASAQKRKESKSNTCSTHVDTCVPTKPALRASDCDSVCDSSSVSEDRTLKKEESEKVVSIRTAMATPEEIYGTDDDGDEADGAIHPIADQYKKRAKSYNIRESLAMYRKHVQGKFSAADFTMRMQNYIDGRGKQNWKRIEDMIRSGEWENYTEAIGDKAKPQNTEAPFAFLEKP